MSHEHEAAMLPQLQSTLDVSENSGDRSLAQSPTAATAAAANGSNSRRSSLQRVDRCPSCGSDSLMEMQGACFCQSCGKQVMLVPAFNSAVNTPNNKNSSSSSSSSSSSNNTAPRSRRASINALPSMMTVQEVPSMASLNFDDNYVLVSPNAKHSGGNSSGDSPAASSQPSLLSPVHATSAAIAASTSSAPASTSTSTSTSASASDSTPDASESLTITYAVLRELEAGFYSEALIEARSEYQSELELLRVTVYERDSRLSELEVMHEQQRTRGDTNQAEAEVAQMQYERSVNSCDKMASVHNSKMQEAKQQLQRQAEEIVKLKQQQEANSNSAAELERLQFEYNELEQQADEKLKQGHSLYTDSALQVVTLRQQCDTLQHTDRVNAAQLIEFKQRIASSDQRCAALQQQVAQLSSQHEANSQQQSHDQRMIESLHSQLADSASKIETSQRSVLTTREQVLQDREKIRSLEAEVQAGVSGQEQAKEQQQQLQHVQHENTQLKSKLFDQMSRASAATATPTGSQSSSDGAQLRLLQAQVQQLQTELQVKDAELQELGGIMGSLVDELETLRQQQQ